MRKRIGFAIIHTDSGNTIFVAISYIITHGNSVIEGFLSSYLLCERRLKQEYVSCQTEGLNRRVIF